MHMLSEVLPWTFIKVILSVKWVHNSVMIIFPDLDQSGTIWTFHQDVTNTYDTVITMSWQPTSETAGIDSVVKFS